MPSDDLLKYFMKHTDTRFDSLERKIEALNVFKWKVIGAGIGTGALAAFVFEVAKSWAGVK